MTNPDSNNDIRAAFADALGTDAQDASVQSMVDIAERIRQEVTRDAMEAAEICAVKGIFDATALAARGVRQLTGPEREYYNAIISGNQSGSAFAGAEQIPPPTIINRVFEDLKLNHDLLKQINFRHTTATTEWLERAEDVTSAFWGDLTDPISELPASGFTRIQMGQNKLHCYMPIHKSMLEPSIGPEWLDRYIREFLTESIAIALEASIVNGSSQQQPLGMIRDTKDQNHPMKQSAPLADLKPATLGQHVMEPLSRNGRRAVILREGKKCTFPHHFRLLRKGNFDQFLKKFPFRSITV